MSSLARMLQPIHAVLVTGALWVYFVLGYLLFFFPAYLVVALRGREVARRFQRLNSAFYGVFFWLLRILVPHAGLRVDPEIGRLRGVVAICNHRSYLDPLLLICLLQRAVTVVKGRFFRVPVLSWAMRRAGYIPADAEGSQTGLVLAGLAGLDRHLAAGGNLFVFPEGTRNPPEKLGTFLPGAFKLARRCRAPLELLYLSHSELIFPPRRFLFRTWAARPIEVERLGRLEPDFDDPGFRLADLIAQARGIYLERMARGADGGAGRCAAEPSAASSS